MSWPSVSLGQIAEIVGGSTPRREQPKNWGAGHFWATPSDLPMPGTAILDLKSTSETITDEGLRSCSTNLLPIGTVLYSTRATIGKLAIADVPVATNQGFNNLIAGPTVYNRYLAYALQFFTPDISRLAGSTTFKEVSRSSLRGFKIPVPPISEQRRIVEILDQANALRKLRREADAKAARILPALFLKMFGDPATNPMGWPVKRLGDSDVCEINPRADRALADDLHISFVPMADVDERLGRITGTQVRVVSEVRKGFTAFRENDVLFAKITPCMQNGKAAIARNLTNGLGYGSTEFHVLRTTDGIAPEWVFALVRLQAFRNQAQSAFIGSAGQQRVPTTFLEQYRVPIPAPSAMSKFAKAADAIFEAALGCETIASRVDTLFSLLLQRAFSGRLTAKWRQAHAQELLAEMREQARLLNLPMPESDALAL